MLSLFLFLLFFFFFRYFKLQPAELDWVEAGKVNCIPKLAETARRKGAWHVRRKPEERRPTYGAL